MPDSVNICDRAEQAPENDDGDSLTTTTSSPSFKPLKHADALFFDTFFLNVDKNRVKIAKVRHSNLIGTLAESDGIMELKAPTQTARN